MKYVHEFRTSKMNQELVNLIKARSKRPVKLMEVCGTHTVSIFRFGIKELLPDNINLISGPGCPVCVTSHSYIDDAITLAQRPEVIITTFGDMLRVPGSNLSLAQAKGEGADVRIVHSSLEALQLAKDNPYREVIFLGIGFETTTPTIAAAILQAHREGISNFSVLYALKLIPGALEALMNDPDVKIDGLICPGHVSSILGTKPYAEFVDKFKIPAVVTGFEPVDILQGILELVTQIEKGEAKVENRYTRGVPNEGNPAARSLTDEVFVLKSAHWRGLGLIENTGLKLKEKYVQYDARKKFNLTEKEVKEHPGCKCGEILRGVKKPTDCSLFGKVCTPREPVGACMVSMEGTCSAYYKYGQR